MNLPTLVPRSRQGERGHAHDNNKLNGGARSLARDRLSQIAKDLATTPPAIMEETLRHCIPLVEEMVGMGFVERHEATDAIWGGCLAAGFVDERGPDAVQQMIADCIKRTRESSVPAVHLNGGSAKSKRGSTAEDDPHWNVEPWPQPVPGAELLDEICAVLLRYMVLPEHAPQAIALWVLHAWTIGASYISPYLVLVSPTKQCGKTTLLTILYWITPRSVMASNISAPSLFRYIEDHKGCPPTLLIDEADSFTKENEALRNILNSGHTRSGAYVIRCEGEGKNIRTRKFSTWAAKVIATIQALADTLMDRSIPIPLRRKAKGERVERFTLRDTEEFVRLRRMCLCWADENIEALDVADPKVPAELDNRPADNWRPLLAIAETAGGQWPMLAAKAARKLSGVSDDQDKGVELLRDVRRVFAAVNLPWLGAKVLCQHLRDLDEAPWGEWRNGNPISTRGVANLLKAYNIKSKHDRDANRYYRADFQEAWDSYLPSGVDLSSTTSIVS